MIYQNKWRIILHHLGEGITEFLDIIFSKEWIPIIFTIVRIKSLGEKKKIKDFRESYKKWNHSKILCILE